MVSERGCDPWDVFLFRRWGLRTQRLCRSEFARGFRLCVLLWFLLEPNMLTTSGRVAAVVPMRWRRRFWRRLKNANAPRFNFRGLRFAALRGSRWRWRRPPVREICDSLLLPRVGVRGAGARRVCEVTSGKLVGNASAASHASQDAVLPCANASRAVQRAPRKLDASPHATVIEQLLLIGGVEPNPGPTDRICYEGWTRDASRFLWPSIGAIEASLASRTKRLLKYFDPRSKGGSLVFAGVNAVLSKTNEALQAQYFPDHTGTFTADMRWSCVKKNLDALLPAVSALDAEAELKAMSKDPKESLLQFICRFQATMQWYGDDQLNSQRAAHILLRKLPQILQRRLASERFAALSVEFIYEKAQDYMNWLSVSPTGWKDSLGDFMDLDTCALTADAAPITPSESLTVNAVANPRQAKPVLDRDSIKWHNIDGPRSLMVAWKKLITTSSRFRQEAQDFLRHRPRFSSGYSRNAAVHFESDVEDTWDPDDGSELSAGPYDSTEVAFAGDDSLNLDAANLHALNLCSNSRNDCGANEDVFYDCRDSFSPSLDGSPDPIVLHDCSTVFAVTAQSSSSETATSEALEVCRTIARDDKKSLHVPIQVCNRRVHALIDTGATACFIQSSLAKKLGVWDKRMSSTHQVRYANGVVEPVLGIVSLDVTLQGQPAPVQAYVLQGKGPPLILGFPFLEAQGLLVDCAGRQLLFKSSAPPVRCCPVTVQSSPPVVKVKRFRVNGQVPLLPRRKYGHDAGVDLFAPRLIHIRPGQRALVDTGLACEFPNSHWCLLKDKSSLAVRHGLTVLGGVVDSNYRGKIQVLLHNLGSRPVTIPRHAPMCQAILLPQVASHFQDGAVRMTTDRGLDASLFQPVPLPFPPSGNGPRRIPRPQGMRL